MAAIAAAAMLTVGAGTAQAGEFDLTAPFTTVTIDGAIFTNTDIGATGSGVIQSFVRVSDNDDIIDGHNTSGRPLANEENTSGKFTRDLAITAVPIVNIGGTDYYEFLLDINQTNADPLISLDQIIICEAATGGLVQADDCPTNLIAYELDASGANWLKLDYTLNSGSGSGDLFMYVPVSEFSGAGFVYLYSVFGEHYNNNDGFEEWAVRAPEGTLVPEPATLLLFGAAIAGGIRRATRRRVN